MRKLLGWLVISPRAGLFISGFFVLLVSDVDVVGASAPGTHAVLKPSHVLWVTADNERPQTVQGGEVVVNGLAD